MPSESNALEIEDINDPMAAWNLTQCPKRFTSDVVEEVNLAQLADSHLPTAGGVLDQSAWWVECWLAFRSDSNQIESDKIRREQMRNHG